jgi:hypothetical protein
MKSVVVGVLVLLLTSTISLTQRATPPAAPEGLAAKVTTGGLGSRYLMLVTSVKADTLTADRIAQFDRSNYDGVAVAFLNAYDTSTIPSAGEMRTAIAAWKTISQKQFWPWVFFNRMVGPDPAGNNPHAQEPYFKRIKGVDLQNETGAMQDFVQYWRNALAAAKDSSSPGIVIDLEFYLDHSAYDPTVLARRMGKTPQETMALLRQLGARLADIAASEYPNATLWFLFTDLGGARFKVVDNQEYYPSPAYLVMGLLDRIKQDHLPLTVISGGEVGLGYCHTSLDQMQMKIRNRAAAFESDLQQYRGILQLGGTITLWNQPSGKSSWIAEGFCGRSPAATAEDLQPYLELLFHTYRYNWIYASGNGSYYAFSAESAPRFDRVISKAKQQTLK